MGSIELCVELDLSHFYDKHESLASKLLDDDQDRHLQCRLALVAAIEATADLEQAADHIHGSRILDSNPWANPIATLQAAELAHKTQNALELPFSESAHDGQSAAREAPPFPPPASRHRIRLLCSRSTSTLATLMTLSNKLSGRHDKHQERRTLATAFASSDTSNHDK